MLSSKAPMTSLRRRAALAIAKRIPVRPVRSRLTGPVASITFDDVPQSATREGAAVLEHAGVRGGFHVCGGHTGGSFQGVVQHTHADLWRLRAAGHEIGCHGFAHLDATVSPTNVLEVDHAQNQAFMALEAGAAPPQSFAYPFGATSVAAKRFYSGRFVACRGVLGGLNAGWVDLAELRAFLFTPSRFDLRRLGPLIDKAARSNAWMVFLTHDVSPDPSSYGCRPDDLAALVAALQSAGVEILPVKTAARLVLGET
jgi:peptidoglycan/xylan/chitin deacetylase (PgdA/CDA1 family)